VKKKDTWTIIYVSTIVSVTMSDAVHTGVEVYRMDLCGTTLALAYILHRLSAAWSQLQMKGRKSEWE